MGAVLGYRDQANASAGFGDRSIARWRILVPFRIEGFQTTSDLPDCRCENDSIKHGSRIERYRELPNEILIIRMSRVQDLFTSTV